MYYLFVCEYYVFKLYMGGSHASDIVCLNESLPDVLTLFLTNIKLL